jgi:hypothetical protein
VQNLWLRKRGVADHDGAGERVSLSPNRVYPAHDPVHLYRRFGPRDRFGDWALVRPGPYRLAADDRVRVEGGARS